MSGFGALSMMTASFLIISLKIEKSCIKCGKLIVDINKVCTYGTFFNKCHVADIVVRVRWMHPLPFVVRVKWPLAII